MNTKTAQHTPGPWTISDEPNGFFIYSEARKQVNDPAIAHIYKDREADSRLIAAAPDLLTACRDFIDSLMSDPSFDIVRHASILDEARAAITKAEKGQ